VLCIGFETAERSREDSSIPHAELCLGRTMVMLSSLDAECETPALNGRSTVTGRYLVVGDVQDIHRRALDAAAQEVFAPEQTKCGTWGSRVLAAWVNVCLTERSRRRPRVVLEEVSELVAPRRTREMMQRA
jgi:hypothetical protein